jgi:hypothetical protein
MGTPTSPPNEPASLREKHLAKAKPPALGKRGPGGPDLGATDPNLKKFQNATSGGGTVKTLLIVLLFVVIAAILLVGLAIFVPAVRALLPQPWQRAIEGPAPPPTNLPVVTPPAVTPPVATPTPAAAPAAAPAAPAASVDKGTPSVK